MSEKYFIKKYNGVDIYYERWSDKFFCETLDGGSRYGKRKSLEEIEKMIDKNQVKQKKIKFEPFDAYYVRHNDAMEVITIKSIRADDGFQILRNGTSEKLSTYEFQYVKEKTFEADKLFTAYQKLQKEIQKHRDIIDKLGNEKKSLLEGLATLDLKSFLRDYDNAETEVG